MADDTVDCLALMLMLMSPHSHKSKVRHKHKHKKNGSVRFSYAYAYAYVAGVLTCFSGASAYAYVLVKTRLKSERNMGRVSELPRGPSQVAFALTNQDGGSSIETYESRKSRG